MDEKETMRRLSIALMDTLSLAKRHHYITKGAAVTDVMAIENITYDFKTESLDFIDYLSRNSDTGLLWYNDQGFPSFEGMERHCPYVLMYRGTRPVFDGCAISIVGTRHATWAALQKSYVLGMECSLSGIDCATGLAEGVDRAAAEGAVEARERFGREGTVIGAIGSGLAVDYPKYTRTLKDRIVASGGCIVTREAPHSYPKKYTFPLRNMVLASVSSAVVVVQAPEASGALITADFAIQAGKDVFVSSAGTDDSISSKGSARLAFEGAPVIDGIDEITGRKTADVTTAAWNEKGSVRYHDVCYKVSLLC